MSVLRYLEEILRGSSPTYPINNRPSIAADIDCNKSPAEVEPAAASAADGGKSFVDDMVYADMQLTH